MYSLKKPLIVMMALLVMGSSGYASGGDPHQSQAHIDLGVEGLYMGANQNSELYLFSAGAGTSPVVMTNHYRDIKYRLGWGAYLGYTFENQADLRLSYRYLQSEGGLDGITTGVTTSSKWRYNALNLDLGKSFMPIDKLHLRGFLGLGYRDLKYTAHTDARGNSALMSNVGTLAILDEHKTYKGIGPRVGMHGLYSINNSIALIGGAAFTLPYGPNKHDADTWTVTQTGQSGPAADVSLAKKINYVVPELDVNVGLRFMAVISDNNNFSIDVGYRVLYLWNVYNRLDVDGASTVTNVQDTGPKQHVAFNGPYIRAGISF